MSIILFLLRRLQGEEAMNQKPSFLAYIRFAEKKAKPNQTLNLEGFGCPHLWRQNLDEDEKLAEGVSAILQKSWTTKIQM